MGLSGFFRNFVHVMFPRMLHKLLWLVPLLACCLFRPAGCGAADAPAPQGGSRSCAFVDRTADEFRCERMCNSDLDFPHALCRLTTPVRTAARTARGGCALKRPAIRPDTCAGRQARTVCAVSRYKRFRAVASGVPAVDFYVYRLRRLII